MGRLVKCTRDRCKKCKYATTMTGSGAATDKGGIVACGYLLKTSESRIFKSGRVRSDYKPGYCSQYEAGERIPNKFSLKNNNDIYLNKERKA